MSLASRPHFRPSGEKHPVFAERLALAIKLSGLKKQHIARCLGLDPGMITYWLRGGEPRLATLVQLARILNVSPNHLLGWPERKATNGHQDRPQA